MLDRLICLLYADTALRRNELLHVRLDQARRNDDGSYTIQLRPEGQKMTGKPAIAMPLLYAETIRLLDVYLTQIRPRRHGKALLVTGRNEPVSPAGAAAAVKRECERLGVRCHYADKLPSPHDLRRTFATLNAAPLGLAMGAEELSARLRDSIEITYKHYVQNNPLVAEERARAYRRRAQPAAAGAAGIGESIAQLASAGLDPNLVALIQKQLAVPAPDQSPPAVAAPSPELTVGEDAALAMLTKAWQVAPAVRALRDHCRELRTLHLRGPTHQTAYRLAAVEKLAHGYLPVEQVLAGVTVNERRLRRLLANFAVLRLGRLRLIVRDSAVDLLRRAIAADHRDNS